VQGLLDGISDFRGLECAGELAIQSSIPVGAGLGSSAALCVAVTRWLAGPLGLRSEQVGAFATRLENFFHGESSGMDVAVCLADAPVRFVRGGEPQPLELRRLPRFTFHDTALRARTSDCVARVGAFQTAQLELGRRTDELMAEASAAAVEGLRLYDAGESGTGLERIARAMSLSHECFERWDLVPPEARALRQELLQRGALAAKLTGAGCGGMVVALWA
jgi:mevalonate kinase